MSVCALCVCFVSFLLFLPLFSTCGYAVMHVNQICQFSELTTTPSRFRLSTAAACNKYGQFACVCVSERERGKYLDPSPTVSHVIKGSVFSSSGTLFFMVELGKHAESHATAQQVCVRPLFNEPVKYCDGRWAALSGYRISMPTANLKLLFLLLALCACVRVLPLFLLLYLHRTVVNTTTETQ